MYIGLRHKATGAVFGESYISLATLGVEDVSGEDGEGGEEGGGLCYHGADALVAVITVTEAQDRIGYSLNLIMPYSGADPTGAPLLAAKASVAAADAGVASVQASPKVAKRAAAMKAKRAAKRAERRRRKHAAALGPEPSGTPSTAPGPVAQRAQAVALEEPSEPLP